MNALFVTAVVATVVIQQAAASSPEPEVMVRTISSRGVRAEIVPVNGDSATQLAGHYSSRSPEQDRRAGPAPTGDDLYLFPDGSYLYLEWGCILPPTIYDKGKWTYQHKFVQLKSDGSLPQTERPRDRSYLPLTSVDRSGALRLMGTDFEYHYFRKHADKNDDFMLLICTKTRVELITTGTAAALYKRLMETAWRPEFFSKSRTK
jgi:hypothetical protein